MNFTRLFEREQRTKLSNLFGRYEQSPQTNMVAGGVVRVAASQPVGKRIIHGKGSNVSRETSNNTKLAYPINYAAAQQSDQAVSVSLMDGKQPTPSNTNVNQSLSDVRRTNIVNVLFKVNNRRRNSKQKVKALTEANEQSFILVRKDSRGRTSKLQLSVAQAIKQSAIANESRAVMPICAIESKLVGYHPAREYLRAERQRALELKLRQHLKIQNRQTTNSVLAISSCQEKTTQRQPQSPIKQIPSIRNATVEDLITHLTEDRRMLATSLHNHPANSNEYILKRRQTNKKDHFVFGMDSRAVCQNKIGLYRDFLWKINYSNGLLVEPQQDYQYKVYVGRGNNRQLIRALLKRRFWWTFVDKLSDDVNLVWTQLKVSEFYEKQQQDFQQQKLPVNKCMNKSQSATNCSMGFLETTNNFSSDSEYASSPKKSKATIPPEAGKVDGHCSIFSESDLNEWRQHYSRHKQIESKLEDKVYVKRTSLLRAKCALKIQQPIQLRVQNHFAFNYFIGNKKAMFYCLRKYYEITNQHVFDFLPLTFHISRATEDPEYKKFLRYYEEFRNSRRQTKTQNVWIVKPGEFTNRGHGITVCETLQDIIIRLKGREKNSNGRLRTFIVQKYLQRPFLYFKRKFDIRHYMMITCVNGKFKGYWYAEGYIRTTSFEYSVKNCRDNLVHLTNDAVQKYCPQYGRYEKGNKLSYSDFQKYLDLHYRQRKLNFQEHVLPKMRRIATDAVKSCYHLLDPNRRPHNFEVFGMDFMIDEEFQPWLIEINTNPCLELACPLLARIIPSMLENAFKQRFLLYRLTIDPLFQPPLDWPANKKYQLGENPLENNRFSLIFDEQLDGPQLLELYRHVDRIDKNMGDIEEQDAEYQDDGGQWNEQQLPPA